MISNDEPNFYMKPYLMNVNNIPELIAFIGFLITSIYMLQHIFKHYQMVQEQQIQRKDEQRDMLLIKKWLIINLLIQILVYLEQIIGYAFKDSETVAILFYFLDYQLIVVFYIIYWQSTLIWTELVIMKTSSCYFLKKTADFLRKYPIVEIGIVCLAIVMFVFYLLKNETVAASIFLIITTIILILFIVVAIFFKLIILNQSSISILTKKNVNWQMLGLIFVITIRLIWNIVVVIPSVDDKLKCFKCNSCNCTLAEKEHPFNWAIYEIVYIPLVNFAPIILLNYIYHPKRQLETKRMLILNTY